MQKSNAQKFIHYSLVCCIFFMINMLHKKQNTCGWLTWSIDTRWLGWHISCHWSHLLSIGHVNHPLACYQCNESSWTGVLCYTPQALEVALGSAIKALPHSSGSTLRRVCTKSDEIFCLILHPEQGNTLESSSSKTLGKLLLLQVLWLTSHSTAWLCHFWASADGSIFCFRCNLLPLKSPKLQGVHLE